MASIFCAHFKITRRVRGVRRVKRVSRVRRVRTVRRLRGVRGVRRVIRVRMKKTDKNESNGLKKNERKFERREHFDQTSKWFNSTERTHFDHNK